MDEDEPMVVDQSELQFESKVQELEADQEFVHEIPDQTNFKMWKETLVDSEQIF